MMRIRFVTLYYPPEVGAAQSRISELARRMAKRGHEVTVLTGFPNYPSGKKPEGYRGRICMKETNDDCRIIRVPHFIAPNRGFFKRLMIHLSFAGTASIASLFMKKDDIMYLESPPLFNGVIGLTAKWLRGIPYVFNVADLWPRTAVEMGLLSNKAVINIALFLEKIFYRQARRILAITQGLYEDIIARGYDEQKVRLLTNGVDPAIFTPDTIPDREVASYRPENGFLIVYAGTHGLIYSLETLLNAAGALRDKPVHFLFIGDGADKPRLQQIAERRQLKNVTFLPPRSGDDMPAVFRAADAAVIALRDIPVSRAVMPLKCFELMAVGCPIIFAARGEMAGHIEDADCGIVIEPENSDAMVSAITNLIKLTDSERRSMGQCGRAYVTTHFSRAKIAKDLETILMEATACDN